jgi:hypothetical protein
MSSTHNLHQQAVTASMEIAQSETTVSAQRAHIGLQDVGRYQTWQEMVSNVLKAESLSLMANMELIPYPALILRPSHGKALRAIRQGTRVPQSTAKMMLGAANDAKSAIEEYQKPMLVLAITIADAVLLGHSSS